MSIVKRQITQLLNSCITLVLLKSLTQGFFVFETIGHCIPCVHADRLVFRTRIHSVPYNRRSSPRYLLYSEFSSSNVAKQQDVQSSHTRP